MTFKMSHFVEMKKETEKIGKIVEEFALEGQKISQRSATMAKTLGHGSTIFPTIGRRPLKISKLMEDFAFETAKIEVFWVNYLAQFSEQPTQNATHAPGVPGRHKVNDGYYILFRY